MAQLYFDYQFEKATEELSKLMDAVQEPPKDNFDLSKLANFYLRLIAILNRLVACSGAFVSFGQQQNFIQSLLDNLFIAIPKLYEWLGTLHKGKGSLGMVLSIAARDCEILPEDVMLNTYGYFSKHNKSIVANSKMEHEIERFSSCKEQVTGRNDGPDASPHPLEAKMELRELKKCLTGHFGVDDETNQLLQKRLLLGIDAPSTLSSVNFNWFHQNIQKWKLEQAEFASNDAILKQQRLESIRDMEVGIIQLKKQFEAFNWLIAAWLKNGKVPPNMKSYQDYPSPLGKDKNKKERKTKADPLKKGAPKADTTTSKTKPLLKLLSVCNLKALNEHRKQVWNGYKGEVAYEDNWKAASLNQIEKEVELQAVVATNQFLCSLRASNGIKSVNTRKKRAPAKKKKVDKTAWGGCCNLFEETNFLPVEGLYKELTSLGITESVKNVYITSFMSQVSASYPPTGSGFYDNSGEYEVTQAKQKLINTIILPLASANIRKEVLKQCTAILIYGPEGSGKNMLVNIVANESGANLFNLSRILQNIENRDIKQDLLLIHKTFFVATKMSPSIILIDDIDELLLKDVGDYKVGYERNDENNNANSLRRIREELIRHIRNLALKDYEGSKKRVIFIGTSSKPVGKSASSRTLMQTFDYLLCTPLPSFETRMLLWSKFLPVELVDSLRYQPLVSSISQVSAGYTAGSIKKASLALGESKTFEANAPDSVILKEVISALSRQKYCWSEDAVKFNIFNQTFQKMRRNERLRARR